MPVWQSAQKRNQCCPGQALWIFLASSNTDTVHCAGLVSGLVQGRAGTITRVTGLVVPGDTVALVSILYLQTLTHGNQVIWSWILHWRLVPMSGFFYFDSFLPSHSHYLLQCYFFSRLSCVRMTHLKDWIRPWILSMWDPPLIMVAHNPAGGH